MSKDKGIFQVVMTPDRIPKFFIPSLDVAHVDIHLKSAKLTEDWCLERRLSDVTNNHSPSVQCNSKSFVKEKSMKKRKTWYKKDFLFLAEDLADCKDVQGAMHDSDPPTRAALSLLHLPKVTTPYGFLTLGESPSIRRRESLFFDSDTAGLRTLMLSQRKGIIGVHHYPPNLLDKSEDQSCHSQAPASYWSRAGQCLWSSWATIPFVSPTQHPADSENCHLKEEKSPQRLMMKHLPRTESMRGQLRWGQNSVWVIQCLSDGFHSVCQKRFQAWKQLHYFPPTPGPCAMLAL